MKLNNVPYELIDWKGVETSLITGLEKKALARIKNFDEIRLRVIEKEPGYRADHFCKKGHIIFVIEGSMDIEFENGDKVPISTGQSIFISDDNQYGHTTFTEKGIKYFIID